MNKITGAFIYRLLLCLLGLCCLQQSYAAQLTKLQINRFDSYTRLIFTLSGSNNNAQGMTKIFTLHHPNRLVVDFDRTVFRLNLHEIKTDNNLITTIRDGRPVPHVRRLVFDLNRAVRFSKAVTAQADGDNAEIAVDVYPINPVVVNVPILKIPKPVSLVANFPRANIVKKAPLQVSLVTKQHPIIVAIDAGHGGKDPGTIGPNGTKEKDVVLAIALRLRDLINAKPNMHAILTRDGDYFVNLRGRMLLARKEKADIFISIHADSYFNNRSSGVSVFSLSRHGATTEAARWLANRENTSELGGIDLGELGDKSYLLRSVLIDLAQTATIKDSLQLGTTVLHSVGKVTKLHYVWVEQAPFMVLKSPDLPSILVETGFLSNPLEEEHLRNKAYCDKLAMAMLNGIQHYFKTHPSIGI